MKHQIHADGQKSGIRLGIEAIREAQALGTMTFGYIFSNTNWLAGGVFFDDTPPMWHVWYIVVPPDNKAPFFEYGADSCQHIDVGEYIKWIRFLIDNKGINW